MTVKIFRVSGLVLACWFGLAQAASAQKLADILSQWGLIGTWATDCKRPASHDNNYISFVVNQSQVSRVHNLGDIQGTNPVVDGKIEADGALTLKVFQLNISQTLQFTAVKGSDGRFRVMSTRNINTDAYAIKDGIFVPEGTPSKWLNHCR